MISASFFMCCWGCLCRDRLFRAAKIRLFPHTVRYKTVKLCPPPPPSCVFNHRAAGLQSPGGNRRPRASRFGHTGGVFRRPRACVYIQGVAPRGGPETGRGGRKTLNSKFLKITLVPIKKTSEN